MSSLNDGIDKARGEMDTAAESVRAAAADIGERSDALLEANETFASENKRQNEEIRALLYIMQCIIILHWFLYAMKMEAGIRI